MGDAILEVNSKPVETPEQLQAEISKSRDSLQLKVGSALEDKWVVSGRQVQKKETNLPTTFEGQKTLVSSKLQRANQS